MQNELYIFSTIQHFHSDFDAFGGYPICVSKENADLLRKELGYVLKITKTDQFAERPYKVEMREGKKFKSKHVLQTMIEDRNSWREEANRYYNGLKGLLNE